MSGKNLPKPDPRRKARHGVVFVEVRDSDRFRLLTLAQRAVYVTLTTFAQNAEGEVWPKQGVIARITGLHLRAVKDAIKRLAELEYISVERQPGGMRRHNIYTLRIPPKGSPSTPAAAP